MTVFPGNTGLTDPRPSVQAVYLLFDGTNGAPLALIDGTELTYRKTAADSALGSRLLSRPDASTLLMVGAGGWRLTSWPPIVPCGRPSSGCCSGTARGLGREAWPPTWARRSWTTWR